MAAVYDIQVNQGATKRFMATYKDSLGDPIDLTDYQGRGSIRFKATDSEAIAEFDVTITDAAAGEIQVELAADALEGLVLKGAGYDQTTSAYYDIELFSATDTIRLLNGKVDISPEITK